MSCFKYLVNGWILKTFYTRNTTCFFLSHKNWTSQDKYLFFIACDSKLVTCYLSTNQDPSADCFDQSWHFFMRPSWGASQLHGMIFLTDQWPSSLACLVRYIRLDPCHFTLAFFVEKVSLSLDLGECLIKIVSVTFSKMLVELVCICVRICGEGNPRFC